MPAPSCPHCRTVFGRDDMNVAEAVAVCPSCASVTRLADLADDPVLAAVNPADVPAGCDRSSFANEVVISASTRSVAGAIGALAIAAFWNGIVSIFVLVATASTLHHLGFTLPNWFPAPSGSNGQNGLGIPLGMTIFLWIFLTPFITIGLGMIAGLVMCLAGSDRVVIRDADATVSTGVGPLRYSRRFQLNDVQAVRIGQSSWTQNDQSKPQVLIVADREIKFGSMLPEQRRNWLVAALREELLG